MNGSLVIIERELLALLRSPRALAILVAVALAFAVIVILKWPSSGIVQVDERQLAVQTESAAESSADQLTGVQAKAVFQWLAPVMC